MFLQAVAIIAPSLVSLAVWRTATRELARNRYVFSGALFLTIVIALPPIQDLFHWAGRPIGNTYLPPVFPIAYVLFGRYDLPSHAFMFAGTFVTLLVGDLVSVSKLALVNDFGFEAFSWIGAAGLWDGLVLRPVLATALSLFVARELKRGSRIRFLIVRNAHHDTKKCSGSGDV